MGKKVTSNGAQSETETEAQQPGAETTEQTGDEGRQESEQNQDDSPDESSWDDKTKSYIKKLRKESQKLRNRFSTLEEQFTSFKSNLKKTLGGEGGDDEATPEELVERHQMEAGRLAFDNGVLAAALEHGVSGSEQLEYFRFLVGQKAESLADDEELDAEDIAEIAKKAMSVGGGNNKASARTSPNESQADRSKRTPNNSDEVSLDQFSKMSVAERSALYNKDKALYERLFSEAKEKRRI